MTVPDSVVRAWGARVQICVSIHIPYETEKRVKELVEARLDTAEAAAIAALTTGPGMTGAYDKNADSSVGVTVLSFDNTGSTT